jgi:acetyl esterase/lipase
VPGADDLRLATDVVFSVPFRSGGDAQPLKLDIAWPKAGGGHPLVLIVHGGGWWSGDKADHRQDILRLAGQGYTAASINYRLVHGGTNRFPAAISDARCAVRWAKVNAANYGADPNRVIAIGASAGANLASVLATAPEAGGLDDGTCELSAVSPSVSGAVSYYGRLELGRAPIPDYLVDYLGRDGDWRAREALGSPLRQVDPTDPPMLLIHGQNDGTVPIEQSRLMRDALVKAQVPVGLLELPDQGHAFPLFGTEGAQSTASCSTLNFLGHFAPVAQLSSPHRTVVYVQKEAVPGEGLFLRGGHDQKLVSQGAYEGSNEPIDYSNRKNPTTFLAQSNDTTLDWLSDSALGVGPWTDFGGNSDAEADFELAPYGSSNPSACAGSAGLAGAASLAVLAFLLLPLLRQGAFS